MPTSPPPSSNSLEIPKTTFVVLLGPDDGSNPDPEEDEVDYLFPVNMSMTATGHRDDVLTFAYRVQPRLVDTTTPIGMKRQLELRALDDDDEPTIVVGWGMMARQPQRVDESAELVTIEARIGDQNFGKKLTFYPTWDSHNEERVDVQTPLIFNPEIDAVIRPNMSYNTDDDHEWNYVLDWDSCWTQEALDWQDEGAAAGAGRPPTLWTLKRIVLALCWWANPDETFITNPTLDDLDNATAFQGTLPKVQNVAIPYGASLPDALDVVLIPLEFSWHLEHSVDDDDLRVTKIRFFRRGTGPVKAVNLQRPDDYRDITKTNVKSFDASYSVIDLANRIECYGDYEKREATFTLQMGWKTEFDNRKLFELQNKTPLNLTNPEIGRLFILNEAGEYNGFRPELTEPYEWDEDLEFTVFPIARRRRFLRCLSQHLDGDDDVSNGFRVDWYNEFVPGAVTHELDDDPGWEKVAWPYSVLEKQCGIMFEGGGPPEFLWNYMLNGHPEDIHVRITATVAGDLRVKGIATRQATSSNGLDLTLVLDVADKFQDSRVTDLSIYEASPTEARNDTDAILTYAQAVRTIEDVMRLDVSIRLEGALHPEILIGDTIPKVVGRNLSLKLTPAGRAPQVVGFNWDFQTQSMELLLESFRKERPRVTHDGGRAIVHGHQAPVQPRTRKQILGAQPARAQPAAAAAEPPGFDPDLVQRPETGFGSADGGRKARNRPVDPGKFAAAAAQTPQVAAMGPGIGPNGEGPERVSEPHEEPTLGRARPLDWREREALEDAESLHRAEHPDAAGEFQSEMLDDFLGEANESFNRSKVRGGEDPWEDLFE